MVHTRVYLDAAAAHPVTPKARSAFLRALSAYGNPGAPHAHGRAARALLEDARTRIARLAGAKAGSVYFTANATEANALAIEGVVRRRLAEGTRREDLHVLYLAGAHASTTKTMEKLRREDIAVDTLPLVDGAQLEEAVRSLLRPTTCLVSLELILSETGMRIDTRAVARLTAGTHTLLHVDASQAPLVESFERTRLAADLLTLDAQKVGGVRGIGALITDEKLVPLYEGGGQERGMRPGTPSPALAQAFATALEEAARNRDAFRRRALRMRTTIIAGLPKNVVVNEGKENAPHIVNVSCLGRDTDYLVALLDEAGFSVSTKSACESDAQEGSRTVRAQTSDTERAASTLRISFTHTTREGEVRRFMHALARTLAFLDHTSS